MKRNRDYAILELDQRDTYLQPIVQLWEANVKITHTFLTEEEIQNIKQYVPQAVEHVQYLCIALSEKGELLGLLVLQTSVWKCCLFKSMRAVKASANSC